MRGADDTVGSAVVQRYIVAIDEVAIGEDNVAEKALLLIRSQRLHDWGFGTGNHAPGFVKIKQKSPKTVAVFLGRAVINLQPTLGSLDRRCSSANPCTIPIPLPAVGQAAVSAPMNQVRRLRQPNVVAAQLRAAGPMERVVFATDLFFKESAVFVVRGKDHPLINEVLPITRGPQSHAHAIARDLRIRQAVFVVDLRNSAVFYAVSLQFAASH